MANWIAEADIYRLRKALDAATDAEQRDRLIVLLKAAQARLAPNPPAVAQPQPDSAKPKKVDRFGGKSLWERQR